MKLPVEYEDDGNQLPDGPVRWDWKIFGATIAEFTGGVASQVSETCEAVAYLLGADFRARLQEGKKWQQAGMEIERIPDDLRELDQ